MMTVKPYLMFNGKCEEAMNFYAKVLDGKIIHLSRYQGSPVEHMSDDANKVMHATMVADGVILMGADTGEGGPQASGSQVHLTLDVDSLDKVEKIFNALSEGGNVTMALQDTFWGARFGMVTDKFGIHWMFNHEKQSQ